MFDGRKLNCFIFVFHCQLLAVPWFAFSPPYSPGWWSRLSPWGPTVTLQQHPVTSLTIRFSAHLTDSKLFLWSSKSKWPSMTNDREAHKQHPELIINPCFSFRLTSELCFRNTLDKAVGMCEFMLVVIREQFGWKLKKRQISLFIGLFSHQFESVFTQQYFTSKHTLDYCYYI